MCEHERRSVAGLLMFGNGIWMNLCCKTKFRHTRVTFDQARMRR